ncbi:hypothetical protein NCAS_0E03970 [Naumovozyma castellii]|uniref:Uncharacterized protein n=1 Tax=Naumovozyma castellii TaxID=27288 RepID=G0VG47_NAUCA|nr:hypothetical protein NCAS_0E03970 [Naumovozyma castellii CBS 4309]CCC70467.1 hypothetical protein NCAS_0E03970 [Naumovozyma castellii CBS 4309]
MQITLDFGFQQPRYPLKSKKGRDVTDVQASPEVSAELGRLDQILNVFDSPVYNSTLKSHFRESIFTTLSRGRSSRYSNMNYSALDPHIRGPFRAVNLRLMNNVESYLSFLSSKFEIETLKSKLTSVPTSAEYDKVAQIRVHDPTDLSKPIFLSMREVQSSPATILAAMFQLYTTSNHSSYPSDYADNKMFGLTINTDIHVLFGKLLQSYNI